MKGPGPGHMGSWAHMDPSSSYILTVVRDRHETIELVRDKSGGGVGSWRELVSLNLSLTLWELWWDKFQMGVLKVVVMLERELHFDQQVVFCLRGIYFFTKMLRFARESTTFLVEGSVLLGRGLLFE